MIKVKRFHVLSFFLNNLGYKKIVEIGVAGGHNGRKILEFCPDVEYIGIDPYTEYDGYTNDNNAVKEKIEANKKEAYEKLFSQDRATHLEMMSSKAVDRFKDNSLEMVFIDGNHSYKYAFQDMKMWWPKIKYGGMLCGHDYNHHRYGVTKAAHDFFDKLGYKIHVHPNRVWTVKKSTELPVVLFFYYGDQYKEKAKNLSKQLGSVKIIHNLDTPDLSDWMKEKPHPELSDRYWVCRFIPTYIKAALLGMKHDVLYVHSDSELKKPFNNSYFKPTTGIGIEQQRHLDESKYGKFNVMAAPLYFEYRRESLEFLTLWEEKCRESNKKSEHEILKGLLNEVDHNYFRIGYFCGILGARKSNKGCFKF